MSIASDVAEAMTAPAHVLEGGGILTAVGELPAGTVTLLFTDVEGSTPSSGESARIATRMFSPSTTGCSEMLSGPPAAMRSMFKEKAFFRLLASIGRRKRVHSRTARAFEPRLA